MRLSRTIPFLLFLGLPLGCEENTDSLDLPYRERLVIEGIIVPGPLRGAVRVARTFPLTANNQVIEGTVLDALVFLRYGDTTRQLHLNRERSLYDNDSIIVTAGNTYTLLVDWNGKHAQATTRVPSPPLMDTVYVARRNMNDSVLYTAEALLNPRADEAYDASWIFHTLTSGGRDSAIYLDFSQAPLVAEDAAADGRIHFLFAFRTTSVVHDTLQFNCTSFDRAYYDFYISRGDPEFSGVPTYSYFEGPVRWNVQGEGVGLFYGASNSHLKVPLP